VNKIFCIATMFFVSTATANEFEIPTFGPEALDGQPVLAKVQDCPNGICPTPMAAPMRTVYREVQRPTVTRTYTVNSNAQWTYPGDIRTHINEHIAGMSNSQLEQLHDYLHNNNFSMTRRTNVFGVSRSTFRRGYGLFGMRSRPLFWRFQR
jgi:hypothetical protein